MESIFNCVPVGLYRTAYDGRVLQANPRLAELLGYGAVEDVLGIDITTHYVEPSDRRRLIAEVDRLGAVSGFETLFRRVDGSPVWVEIFARACDDGSGRVLTGMMNDITSRKQLEGRVARFSRAADASGEVIFMTDREGVFTYVNPAFTRVYGYDAEEVIGQHTPRLLKSGLYPASYYEHLWTELLAGRSVSGEYRNRRKDSSLVLIDGCANPVTDDRGTITGFFAIQRDITVRRQMENALHESEALFRAIFDQLPVGAALLSMDRRIHRANAALCGMLDRREDDLRGRNIAEITHPEDEARSLALARELSSGAVEQIQFEKRYLRPDGGAVWGAVVVRLIKDTDGRPLWMMAVISDMTERRRLEQQLRQAQKMEAVGELAGGIAHDFNNILTAMMGYSELLLDRVGANTPVAREIEHVQNAGRRAAALTRQLLAFSRKQVLRLDVADLNTVLEKFRHLVRPLISEDIDLRFELSQAPVPVLTDVAQLEQVAMNLIVNARDAMPHGGVIRVRTATVRVDEERMNADGAVPPGTYVQLVVEDTGTGMEEETRRRIFEPFFTTKGPGRGTGLGLSVVYGIVKQMGGFIWVYSELGRGTTFKVYFPRAAASDSPELSHAPPSARRRGTERILLVEDDRDVRTFAAHVLRRHGYTVTEACDGTEALACLRHRERPHLVITDVVMPGMSGPELARRIEAEHPSLKVLFTSGYMDHHVLGDLDDERTVDLLEKPFSTSVLLERVRGTLDRATPSTSAP